MNSHSDNRISMNNSEVDDLNVCPSFNCYTSEKLVEIAVKVTAENGNDYDEEDFEFSLIREDKEELLFDGGGATGPIYPVFNRDVVEVNNKQPELESITIPLRKLFIEDDRDDDPPSCSSSEASELESLPSDTYCVWRPSLCKKSKSTGSVSKRWKFRDLLRRSNSDGKDSLVFLTPKQREEKGSPSAHEALYVRNRAVNEWNKKKSYLPYRQGLVGFFANANGLGGKSFPHL